jgi:predicted nucleic acid-binding protein
LSGWFFDTSAFAKLYHPEKGTARTESIINGSARVWISRLTAVELTSVFAKKVRTGVLGREAGLAVLGQFQADFLSRRFDICPVRSREFEVAEQLIRQHAFDSGLRSLDAIQLAAAHRLKALGSAGHFLASDRILCRIATLEGFSVVNPEDE